jgi:hypothetical protein
MGWVTKGVTNDHRASFVVQKRARPDLHFHLSITERTELTNHPNFPILLPAVRKLAASNAMNFPSVSAKRTSVLYSTDL